MSEIGYMYMLDGYVIDQEDPFSIVASHTKLVSSKVSYLQYCGDIHSCGVQLGLIYYTRICIHIRFAVNIIRNRL